MRFAYITVLACLISPISYADNIFGFADKNVKGPASPTSSRIMPPEEFSSTVQGLQQENQNALQRQIKDQEQILTNKLNAQSAAPQAIGQPAPAPTPDLPQVGATNATPTPMATQPDSSASSDIPSTPAATSAAAPVNVPAPATNAAPSAPAQSPSAGADVYTGFTAPPAKPNSSDSTGSTNSNNSSWSIKY